MFSVVFSLCKARTYTANHAMDPTYVFKGAWELAVSYFGIARMSV